MGAEKKEAEEKEAAEKKAAEEAEAAAKAEAEAKEAEEAKKAESAAKKEKEELEKKENQMTKEEMAEVIANALKPVQEELAAAKADAKNALDASAKAPEFKKVDSKKEENAYADLSSEELFAKQLNAAVAVERMHSVEGRKTLD